MLQLVNDDFYGFTLPNHKGIIVIYFKQERCKGCTTFDPTFFQLERKKQQYGFGNINFAVVNLTTNPQILNKASPKTLDRTPLIMIFYQGRPYAKYNGHLIEQEIFDFINQVINVEMSKGPVTPMIQNDAHPQMAQQHIPQQHPQIPQHPPQQHNQWNMPIDMAIGHSQPLNNPQQHQMYGAGPPDTMTRGHAGHGYGSKRGMQQPLHMSQIKGKSAGSEQMYVEDLTEGLFDNWNYLPSKEKIWMKDLNLMV